MISFTLIQDRFGITGVLPHINGTPHCDYREYYDDVSRELIADKYGWAIDYFGYTFD